MIYPLISEKAFRPNEAMVNHPRGRGRPNGVSTAAAFSRHISRAPETAKFLRRAAPAFFREIAKDYSRESLPAPHHPKLALWPDTGLHAAWFGHSTVLLKLNGFTILTDPVFSSRVGLRVGPLTVGIKRLVEVSSKIIELPTVDLILLSHAHMDHFDLPSLRQLENRKTTIVTAVRTSDLLRSSRYAVVHELHWNESVQVGPATIRAFEVNHWGARMRSDVYRGYNGYLVECGGHRVVFGGDTAFTDSFSLLKSEKRIDLAVMPIGAYDPWIRVHCNPEQAAMMATRAGAEYILPVHHKTFQLSREPSNEPLERLIAAAGSSPDRICLHDIGGEFHL